ncbi:ArnT family glycosyltransferase [Kolteria novifilia]|uniref:ArnT family glycosyltransferase n=1 Tax=Kolteria novifilia TaxID=2527975 RepID=UPI003AF3930B
MSIPSAAIPRRDYLIVLCLAFASTLPFLNKAFHIDDVLYLRVAGQIVKDPLDPFGGRSHDNRVLWDAKDGQPATLFEIDYNPPLWKYVLATIIGLFGIEEWKLHLAQSVAVCFAGFGLYHLSRRLTSHPLWATAMILFGPFFLPGQNLMLEGPLLCFWSWSLVFAWKSWDTDRLGPAWLAGLFAGLALMTKYTAGLLWPLLVIGALGFRRPRALVALIPPVLMLSAWSLHNILFHGEPHLSSHGMVFRPELWGPRLLVILRSTGAVTVFGPVVAIVLVQRGRWGWLALVGCLLAAGAAAWGDLLYVSRETAREALFQIDFVKSVHVVLFTFHGVLSLLGIAVVFLGSRLGKDRPWRFDEEAFLSLWILMMLLFNITSVPFNAVRHLLLFFVPLVFLLARLLEGMWAEGRWRLALLSGSALLALAIAIGDAEIAGAYRRTAIDTVRPRTMAGIKTWATGNWGFLYYSVREGANPLFAHPEEYGLGRPAPGDVVVHPRLITWSIFPPSDDFPALEVVEHRPLQLHWPLRTLFPAVNYYAIDTYALPWQIPLVSTGPEEDVPFEFAPLDDIIIYSIRGGIINIDNSQ